jgi:hypothetical protein
MANLAPLDTAKNLMHSASKPRYSMREVIISRQAKHLTARNERKMRIHARGV